MKLKLFAASAMFFALFLLGRSFRGRLSRRALQLAVLSEIVLELSRSVRLSGAPLSELLARFSDSRFAPFGKPLAKISAQLSAGVPLKRSWESAFAAFCEPDISAFLKELMLALQRERRAIAASQLEEIGERAKQRAKAVSEYARGDGEMYEKLSLLCGALLVVMLL